MTYNIFISYSTKDLDTAKWLEQSLLTIKNSKVFLAHSNLIIGSLSEALVKEIKHCDLFIVLYSREAHESPYVQQEIGVAKGSNKTIIPIATDSDVKPGAMLEGISYVPFYNRDLTHIRKLYDYVNKQSNDKDKGEILLALGIVALYLISNAKNKHKRN